MPFWGRKIFVSHSKIAISADDLPDSLIFWQKHHPRLHESLAESTHGVDLSRRSEVVFNSTRDLLPKTRIFVRPGIGTAREAPIWN
ncbi:hypothetical protein Taro_047113 [Colocasia esculenta]|uniref:Uncharacterized protein n=1 Tax=Colocasia esculenta TaxID=4460 RepID=A0A843WUD4_COLES|nr:hypothetical protein [Colocasia esculenta]